VVRAWSYSSSQMVKQCEVSSPAEANGISRISGVIVLEIESVFYREFVVAVTVSLLGLCFESLEEVSVMKSTQ
jgi:hypothetical protein